MVKRSCDGRSGDGGQGGLSDSSVPQITPPQPRLAVTGCFEGALQGHTIAPPVINPCLFKGLDYWFSQWYTFASSFFKKPKNLLLSLILSYLLGFCSDEIT